MSPRSRRRCSGNFSVPTRQRASRGGGRANLAVLARAADRPAEQSPEDRDRHRDWNCASGCRRLSGEQGKRASRARPLHSALPEPVRPAAETAALAAPDHLAGARRHLGTDSNIRAALAGSVRRPGLAFPRDRAVQPAGTIGISLRRVLAVPQPDPGHRWRCAFVGRDNRKVANDSLKLVAGPQV